MTVDSGAELRTFLIVAIGNGENIGEGAGALEVFAGLARDAIGGGHGTVVEHRPEEILAAFQSPHAAVRAAAELQSRWKRAVDEDPRLDLPVRMGLDAGEAIPVAGGFRGRALNLAARLAHVADPGEVLASEAVLHLTAEIDDANFGEVRTFALKGFFEDVRAVSVTVNPTQGGPPTPTGSAASSPTVASTFRAAGGLTGRRNNLPSFLTSFVGREKERVQVRELLESTRLLTLTGTGGNGKTRLAITVAGDLRPWYPGGVWLIDLASLSNPSLVCEVIAATLSVRQRPGRSALDALADAIGEIVMLLILDNCEHLVDACAEIAETLLSRCPGLRILATSRVALDVGPEVIWQVPPLSLPDPNDLRTMESSEAVQLFVQRARFKQPGFALTPASIPIVAAICRQVDGIPLALELAAARVGVLSLEQIASRLQRSLALLSGGSRTAPPHQQTILGTLDWSYELLDEEEKRLFRRLSVFTGGWTLDAAEAVGGTANTDPYDVLDVLSRLIDKSVVVAEAGTAGGIRYRLLEPVRQYGLQRLAATDEMGDVCNGHATFFSGLVVDAETGLKGAQQVTWLHRLEDEHDNVRQAMAWLTEHDRVADAVNMGWALWHFWLIRGCVAEGQRYLESALARTQGLPAITRGKALHATAAVVFPQGDFERALELNAEAIELLRAANAPRELAFALVGRGYIDVALGNIPDGFARFEESLDLYRRLGDRWGVAGVLGAFGRMAIASGDLDRAVTYLMECLSILTKIGNTWERSWNLHVLATVRFLQGNYADAAEILEESIELSRRAGDRVAILNCLETLAGIAAVEGRARRAAILFGAVDVRRKAIGSALMTPAEVELRDRNMEMARQAVPEDQWTGAWDEGRAMTIKEAIDFALTDRIDSKSATGGSADESAGGLLTPREQEIAVLVAQGLTNRQIAGKLAIAERTVDTHVGKILGKLKASSRAQIATWVTENGLGKQ